MPSLDTCTSLSADALATAIAEGPIEIAPSFSALVDVDPQDQRMFKLSLDRTCTGWFSIARSLIASLAPRSLQACGDHRHLLALMRRVPGADKPTRGLMRLLAKRSRRIPSQPSLPSSPRILPRLALRPDGQLHARLPIQRLSA